MYGLLTIFPVSRSFSPFFIAGPIISKADMYWLLTSPGISNMPPSRVSPVIRSGGKPSSSVYSICAPSLRRASTSTRMGRCFMRSVPVMTCSPGVTLR